MVSTQPLTLQARRHPDFRQRVLRLVLPMVLEKAAHDRKRHYLGLHVQHESSAPLAGEKRSWSDNSQLRAAAVPRLLQHRPVGTHCAEPEGHPLRRPHHRSQPRLSELFT